MAVAINRMVETMPSQMRESIQAGDRRLLEELFWPDLVGDLRAGRSGVA